MPWYDVSSAASIRLLSMCRRRSFCRRAISWSENGDQSFSPLCHFITCCMSLVLSRVPSGAMVESPGTWLIGIHTSGASLRELGAERRHDARGTNVQQNLALLPARVLWRGQGSAGWRPFGLDRVDFVRREAGRRMIDSAVEIHEMGIEVQHERSLEDASMLDRPAGKAIWIETCDRFGRHEVPVRQEHDLRIPHTVPAQFLERKVDALHQEPGILVVAVDKHEPACTVARELQDHVLEGRNQRGAIEAGGAWQVVAAARLLMRLVAIGKAGSDQSSDDLGSTARKLHW